MTSHLKTFRKLIRQGDFHRAHHYADQLPVAEASTWDFQFEKYRAYLLQGDLIQAGKVLTGMPEAIDAGRHVLQELEHAYLEVLIRMDFQSALLRAEKAIGELRIENIPDGLKAEAERVHIRLLLTAATYHVINREEAAQARDRLPEIARRLIEAGRREEAFSARLTYAQRLDLPAAREALEQVALDAREQKLPAVAGEALLILAEQQLKNGALPAVIEASLERSKKLYHRAKHVYGAYEVEVVSAKSAHANSTETAERLRACLEAYRERAHYRGVLHVLMDLSSLAHQQGATGRAMDYRKQTLAWAERIGMDIATDGFITAQIDLLMRNADFGEAIELCRAALSGNKTPMSRALYEQLLASAYTFTHNLEAACRHGRTAIQQFEQLGAVDAASDAVLKYTADLNAMRKDEAWVEAEVLLEDWINKDEQRGDVAAQTEKLELSAQICIQKFLYSPKYRGQEQLLTKGEDLVARALAAARQLAGLGKAKKLANLAQISGQFHQSRGNEDQVLASWKKALGHYQKAGLQMESANSHYIIGILHLNRANQDLVANFGISEDHLLQALDYYGGTGMRNQGIDTRYMLALLYKNAALSQQNPLRDQLIDAALLHLQRANEDAHAIRSAFRSGTSVLEIQSGKSALSRTSHRVHQLALEIVTRIRVDSGLAWAWTQRMKARALADLLGLSADLPAAIRHDPEAMKWVEAAAKLTAQLEQADAKNRTPLRESLSELQKKMRAHPHLSDYLELQQGMALDLEDLHTLLAADTAAFPGKVYIDWVSLQDQLFLIAVRDPESPQLFPLSIRLSEVTDFVKIDLSPESFRTNLKYVPDLLDRLTPLIQPLADITRPEELLIFCPTGALHHLPLHALALEGVPLLERNPVVYTPSSMIWRHCLSRRPGQPQLGKAALFGDPSGDRPAAAAIVHRLEQQFNTPAYLAAEVTRETFLQAIRDVDLIHFQGHAVHHPAQPLDAHLVLADGLLTAREIFESIHLNAALVSLAACETATSQIAAGDEPQGLIPAFLHAGASTILATLWKVHEASAALCMQIFFNKLDTFTDQGLNKAQALRAAMREVKNTEGFQSLYHWAPFVLYGHWK